MSDQIADGSGENIGEAIGGEEAGAAGRRVDPGFKRNMKILGGTLIVAVAIIGVTIYGAKSKIDSTKSQGPSTQIPGSQPTHGGTATVPTQADEERLGRVQTRESVEAHANKDTYIPKELTAVSVKAPDANSSGPGTGYDYNRGETAGAAPAVDPQREARINEGIKRQLESILGRLEAPGTQVAAPYVSPIKDVPSPAGPMAVAPGTDVAGGSSASTSGKPLVEGLTIAGGRLVSPLDTEKTAYVSAEISSGPFAGAFLVGSGKMVEEAGVLLKFNRMKFNGEDYVVDVTALDNATSSDAMNAEIDRKVFSRYVMPVVFSSAQAYLTAMARPPQNVITGGLTATQVVTPASTAREAIAAGMAAGVGKAGSTFGQAKPSAYMHIDTPVALLFNEAVQKKVKK